MPDLAGWRVENFSEHEQVAYSGHQDVAYFTTAPDWVCEILSPSTRKLDRGRKRDIYAREGVSWLWLPDPGAPTLKRSPCRKADERPSPPSPATRSSRFPPSTTSPFPCPNSVFAVATGNPEAAAVRVARRVAMSNGCHGPASSGSRRSPRSAYPAGRLPFCRNAACRDRLFQTLQGSRSLATQGEALSGISARFIETPPTGAGAFADDRRAAGPRHALGGRLALGAESRLD